MEVSLRQRTLQENPLPLHQGMADNRITVLHPGNDANLENGAFARFIAVKGDLQMHIPDDVSFEAACTAGVGIGTTGYALYKVLGLPFPNRALETGEKEKEPILIYGGSTATGTLAIQFAKL
jgi:NADPH:quinone reductase-like Zn-dependent oxidoreductase